MKNKLSPYLKVLLMCIVWIPAFAGMTQAVDSTAAKKYPVNKPGGIVYEYEVTFAADSLALKKLDMIEVLPFSGYTASISWKFLGTTPNVAIRQYVTNYFSKDSSYWHLVNEIDTTNHYTGKAGYDTLKTQISGMPFRYAGILVKGLAGNRRDVTVRIRVALRKND